MNSSSESLGQKWPEAIPTTSSDSSRQRNTVNHLFRTFWSGSEPPIGKCQKSEFFLERVFKGREEWGFWKSVIMLELFSHFTHFLKIQDSVTIDNNVFRLHYKVGFGTPQVYILQVFLSGWLPSAKLKPTFTFPVRDFATFNTFTWQNPFQEKWKLVLALHSVASPLRHLCCDGVF